MAARFRLMTSRSQNYVRPSASWESHCQTPYPYPVDPVALSFVIVAWVSFSVDEHRALKTSVSLFPSHIFLRLALPATPILQSVARAAAADAEITHRHEHAAYADVGAQPLAYPRSLPKDAHHAVLVAVHDAGEEVVHVGRRADEEEDDEEEGLEVEEGGLRRISLSLVYGFRRSIGTILEKKPWIGGGRVCARRELEVFVCDDVVACSRRFGRGSAAKVAAPQPRLSPGASRHRD